MDGVKKCRECGSADLFWFAVNINKSGVAEGRLRTHEVTCRFVLGCHECSETLQAVDADRIAEQMNSDRSELAALREELADTRDAFLNQSARLVGAEQRNAAMREALETLNNYGFDPNSGSGSWGEIRITLEDWNLIQAALKPTESGAGE